jgi:sugar transferase (PEP-CTERM/EpsH1 system associated)
MRPAPADPRPLLMHVVFRFDTGGLENGLVNLINHLPANQFRHMVVALTNVTEFSHRIRHPDVPCVALNKGPGHAVRLYPRLFALMREHRPTVVHTRNLAALEAVVPAWAAGVPIRIHGEHGRDVGDLDGSSRSGRRWRKLYRPFVTRYVALSRDLADYLVRDIGVAPTRVTQIYNGVDSARFRIAESTTIRPEGFPFDPARHWVVGTVGRMQVVKNQTSLVDAFLRALAARPEWRDRLRLVLVGDGPLRTSCQARLEAAGASALAWVPGERSDVADIMRALHCFVLPSLAEGISNTVLEAMACGLPVLATDVGGNADLVRHGETGIIVPGADDLPAALESLAAQPEMAAEMGRAGRARAQAHFSLPAMVEQYRVLYREAAPGLPAQPVEA